MEVGLVNVVLMVVEEQSEDHSVAWKTTKCNLDNCIIEVATIHKEL
jgi:hypothetical protein